MPVSIESFNYGEDDGTGDVNFTLSLKEYVILTYSVPEKKTNASSGKTVKNESSSKEENYKKR